MPEVFAELKAIISDFTAKMAEARGEMEETEKSGGSSMSGLSSLASGGLAALGAAAVAATVVCVDLGLKFQTSTAQMAAAGNIPIKTAQQIGQAFLHSGADTIYTASQMEQAYGSVAGQLSTLKGYTDNATTATKFMKVAMDLAEESGSSLGSATSDLAKLLQAYGLNINQASGASVNMFNASRLTGQSIDSLTQGMTRLHSQMGIATPDLADASALLVDLTEHGETGRQAMSSLSSMFTGIIAPTAAVTKAQQEMGVSFENAHGQLLPMSQIIAELGPKIDGMGTAQAAATLKTLGLGSASLKLVSTIQAGPAAFNAATAAVNNTAAAHNALSVQQQTLDHMTEALKVQLENMATRIGVALIPILKDLVVGLSAVFGFIDSHQHLIRDLANVLFFVMGGAIIYVALHWREAWQDMQNVFNTVVGGLEGAANDFVGFFTAIPGEIYNNVIQPIINFFEALPGRIINILSGLGSDIVNTITHDIPGAGIVGGALKSIGGIFQEGGFVPGSGPQLAIVHGGEYVLNQQNVQALTRPGGSGSFAASGGSTAAGGGGDLVMQIDGQTFARLAGPALRQWLNTVPGRNAVLNIRT